MSTSTLVLLAAPAVRAARARAGATAAGLAVAGGLLLVTAALFRVPATALPPRNATGSGYFSYDSRYAGLVTSAETRIGVATAVLLLAGTALLLAWQAATSGSARRARRDHALATAGATPGQLRRLGALEAGAGGLAGGVLAGPTYLVLWLLLGPAQPAGSRLLPGLAGTDVLIWVGVVLLMTALSALAGAVTTGGAHVRPSRAVRSLWSVVLAALGVASIAFSIGTSETAERQVTVASMCTGLVLILVAVLSLGSLWVRSKAARMRRRSRPSEVLAASGLTALAGPAGRAGGVLFGVGLTVGVVSILLGNILRQSSNGGDYSSFFPALALAVATAGLASVAALATIALAAADDLLTSTRSLAALAAVGADTTQVMTLQRRRLRAATIGPLVCGLLIGGVGYWAFSVAGEPAGVPDIWPFLIAGPVSVGLLLAATSGTVQALGGRTASALDPSQLRVA